MGVVSSGNQVLGVGECGNPPTTRVHGVAAYVVNVKMRVDDDVDVARSNTGIGEQRQEITFALVEPGRHSRPLTPITRTRVDQDGAAATSKHPRLQRDDHPVGIGLPMFRRQPVRVGRPHLGSHIWEKFTRRQERFVPLDGTDDLDVTQDEVLDSFVTTHEFERTPIRKSSPRGDVVVDHACPRA